MITVLFISLLSSAVSAFFIVRFSHLHQHVTSDTAFGEGPQKIHHEITPRIGGVAIAIGLIAGLLAAVQTDVLSGKKFQMWILCVTPIFFAGLAEDITKKVGARWRLGAAFGAALLALILLDGEVPPPGTAAFIGQPFYPALCVAFTLFAVGGVTHAFNIMDGLHGLLGGMSILTLAALAWMSDRIGDSELFIACLSLLGGVFGFLIFNFPFGKLFAGDAGAYLIGFVIAEISVLLSARHPEVSPWFILLLLAYPVTEVLFSIYRRSFLKQQPAGKPDGLHLHSLLYKRIGIWIWDDDTNVLAKALSNSFATVLVWVLMLLPLGMAVLFCDRPPLLICGCIGFMLCYVSLYWGLVRFKTPRWLLWIKAVRYHKNAKRLLDPACRE